MTIELDGLTTGYRTKGGTITVSVGITASVEAKHLTCLIGENGVGKSTLLRTLAGFQPALAGHIYIKDKDMALSTPRELAREVSVVLTAKPDLMNMTVSEIVGLGRTPYTGFWGTLRDDDKQIVGQSMEAVGIAHLASRMISTLSDGERQKMMIAKALAQMTPVIILDEPTAFLDYPSKIEMMRMLKRLSREAGKTVFLSTHDIDTALQIADTLWLMTRREPLITGSPSALAANGALNRFIDRQGITFQPSEMRVRIG